MARLVKHWCKPLAANSEKGNTGNVAIGGCGPSGGNCLVHRHKIFVISEPPHERFRVWLRFCNLSLIPLYDLLRGLGMDRMQMCSSGAQNSRYVDLCTF